MPSSSSSEAWKAKEVDEICCYIREWGQRYRLANEKAEEKENLNAECLRNKGTREKMKNRKGKW